jgi:hypothetical protein
VQTFESITSPAFSEDAIAEFAGSTVMRCATPRWGKWHLWDGQRWAEGRSAKPSTWRDDLPRSGCGHERRQKKR